MANDKIFLVCRGCRATRSIFKYLGSSDDGCPSSVEELDAFMREHLYHNGHHPDGFHLTEPAPFEVLTEHVLMRRDTNRESS